MSKTFLPLLILSLIACCIEVDISVASFPDMAYFFNVSDGMIQLTVAYNFLGFCLASIFYGPLSECYGRRKIMIIGNAILLLGALACVYAPSIQFLLIARFIQGIGASTSAVVVFAMIADVYHGNKKGVRLVGIMNASLTTIMAMAPTVGAFINQTVGWRGNYGCVAIICLFSWLFLLFMLPETKKDKESLDPAKILRDYKKLLSSIKFISASMIPSILYSAYMSFIACGSFLYIETFGLSVTAYAFHQASIISCCTLISIFSDRIVEALGARQCIIIGKVMCSLGALLLVVLSLTSPNSPYLMTASMIIFCIGFAICYPVIFTNSLEIYPEIKGTASSAIMSMRALVCSAFVGLTGYLYNGEPITVAMVILLAVILSSCFTFNLLHSPLFKQHP